MATCATRPKKYPHVFTAGDRLPEILGTLDGVDLTGYTIEFDLVQPDGTVIQKSTATSGVQITDAAAGQFKITWLATDLVKGRDQTAQVRFIDSGGLPLTSQDFWITVKSKHRS
ncbi:MAG: hypothetical protein KJO95_08175 [Gammaproteobacteria bacterium]|nr:hypothetical protein [Gammaproteobacteria bacterium]